MIFLILCLNTSLEKIIHIVEAYEKLIAALLMRKQVQKKEKAQHVGQHIYFSVWMKLSLQVMAGARGAKLSHERG